jgi:hypothetical protein
VKLVKIGADGDKGNEPKAARPLIGQSFHIRTARPRSHRTGMTTYTYKLERTYVNAEKRK